MPRDAGSTERLYDRWAEYPWVYETMTWVALFGRREQLRQRAIDSLRLRPGDLALALACGSGADLPGLASAVGPSGSVIAVDLSERMLEAAARRAERERIDNVEFVRQDLRGLDLGDRAADGAVISLALSAVPDRLVALRRIRAALRPGGALAVLDTLPFAGRLAVLNPLIGRPFRAATNWDYRADLIAELEQEFDTVDADRLHRGSALLARAVAP